MKLRRIPYQMKIAHRNPLNEGRGTPFVRYRIFIILFFRGNIVQYRQSGRDHCKDMKNSARQRGKAQTSGLFSAG